MKTIKKMIHERNWKVEEIKEAASAALLASTGMALAYIIIWMAY